MCGIAGIRFTDPSKGNKNYILNSLNALKHRGPDHQSVHSEKNIHLGHTRLSIIDINDRANQPMLSDDENYSLVFNGEIYNFGELRNDLLKLGHQFNSSSDTEVLLKGLIEFGIEYVNQLNGFFAFAFYDKSKDDLFVARDRMGIKSLLYYADENQFCFASELSALMAFDFDKEIRKDALKDLLKFTYIPAPKTILKSVHKLEPGTYLKCKAGIVSKTSFFEIKEIETSNLGFEDAAKELKFKLENSVSNRLTSDVALGTFLSGGYDSSIITAIAADQKNDLNTFSIGFKDNPYFDESETALKTAQFLGTKHHAIQIPKDALINDLDSILDSFDEPFGDSSAIAVYFLAKETRNHVTVALSGDGADELFAGYNKHKAIYKVLNDSNTILKLAKPFSKIVGSNNTSKIGNVSRKIEKFNALLSQDPASRYEFLAAFNQDAIVDSLLSVKTQSQINFLQVNNLNDFLIQDQRFVLPNDMLKKVDLMSMRHSLEVRTPFLDHELVNYSNSLPENYKIRNGDQKSILKEAFRDMLPKHLFGMPKKGFEVPLTSWLMEVISAKFGGEIFSQSYINQQGLFNFDFVEQLKTNQFLENSSNASLIWSFLVFQTWYDKHIKNA
jgi:asparagine synthase (glutamine-hydrolysing)